MNQNELNFIQHELSIWAAAIEKELKNKLVQKNIEHTGDLLRSLSYKVFQASGGNSGGFSITFYDYGRFVDMGAGRARLNTTVADTTARLKARKPVKWYSKPAYKLIYGPMLASLYKNYSEAIVYTIKQMETNGQN